MKPVLFPVIALVGWTLLVQLNIAVARIGAGLKGRIRPNDFKYGESPAVPPDVSIANRNYMNLLEAPILFYVACIVSYVTGGATALAVGLAWLYVGLRIVHSVIHLTYNNVLHRLAAFAFSNFTLLGLWIVTGVHVVTMHG